MISFPRVLSWTFAKTRRDGAVDVVLSNDAFGVLRDVFGRSFFTPHAIDVDPVSNGVVIERIHAEFFTLGTEFREKPRDDSSNKNRRRFLRTATELGLVVRDDGLHDERASIATGHGRGDVQIVSN